LAHPKRKAPHAQTAANVPVDGICNVGLGHSHPIVGLTARCSLKRTPAAGGETCAPG
jgi:hypothetical protein